MKFKVELLPSAWEDLKKIEDYYILQFGVETALLVTNHILSVLERLEHFPNSGSLTPDEWLDELGYRMIICKKHIAVYKLIDDTAYIYHIADSRSEYTKLFH